MIDTLLLVAAGIAAGALVTFVVFRIRERQARALAEELFAESETRRKQELDAITERMKDSFGALSLEALSRNARDFLTLAGETLSKQSQIGAKELEEKKGLIDQTLTTIREELEGVEKLVTSLEKDREQKFGELTSSISSTARQLSELQETTQDLRNALASSKARGQWGERMAEDVLRLAGFMEGVNYLKQKSLETAGSRPDYTFLLPQQLKVNMDVKFPLDNYLRFLESDTDTERETHKNRFLKDVKDRVKEVTTRDYINPEENTIDFVIVFIPNEQVYAFINQHDSSLLDEAMKNKVILCSPITLYAILAIIRQAVDNFNLERTAAQILSLLGTFRNQYGKFVESMEKMGKKIDDAQREYHHLTTTRRNQLERPLRKIESLRDSEGIPAAELSGEEDDTGEIEEEPSGE